MHLLGQHLRTQRLRYFGSEGIANANAFLQGYDIVPVTHGHLFTTTDKRIYGVKREAGCSIALGVYRHMQICNGEILIDLVLTVHIYNLVQDAQGVTQIIGHLRGPLYGYAYNDVGSHLSSNICGIIVLQTSIHQHHIAQSYG